MFVRNDKKHPLSNYLNCLKEIKHCTINRRPHHMARRWLKADLHTHTHQDPDDGGRIVFHTPEELIDLAADKGFDVLAITNHNLMLFSEHLESYAWERGILLIPGVEATVEGRHILLYNFSDYQPSWQHSRTVRQKLSPDRLVVAPHPFFPIPTALRQQFFKWWDLFDALEYSHFYLHRVNFNRRAERVARRFNLPLIGNSDLHRLDQLDRTYTLIHAEQTVADIIQAIKAGQVRLITRPESPSFFVSWFAVNTANRSRHTLRELFSR